MSLNRTICLVFPLLILSLLASFADARAIRFDDALGTCETTLPGGSLEVSIVEYDGSSASPSTLCDTFTDPSLSGFSINYFGSSYDSLFLNDNGTLSFGSAFTGVVGDSLLDSSVPVIGGFFTDGPKRFKVGYTAGTFSIDIDVLAAPGSFDVVASSQVILIDRGFGNFDLELNYGPIFGSGIAQAGFADGAGGGYLLPGSGIAGAFDGDDLAFGGPICTPTSLTCGLFNASEFFDEDSDTRMPALGRYRFNFVNGVPQSLPMADVPAPGGLLLLLGGLVMLRGTRSLG